MFKNWIALFFNNMENAVQLNGFLSDFFIIGRGCRQGDPISAYIFILCAEILAIKIRKCKQMKGITIDNEEYKISQFADDTYLLMDGSKETLNTALQLLHSFSQYSGLNVNFEKTHVVWIGSLKYSTRSIKTRWKLVWGCTQFKFLGLNFDVDLPKMIELNYNDKLVKLENIIAHWNRRELTPLGRITVVKTLILPMFIHLFVSLPQPGEAICKVLNDKVLKFVWQGPSKIKAKVITKDFDEGGLKMVDINAFMKSLKLSWIRKVIQGQNKFTSLARKLIDFNILCNTGSLYAISAVKNITNAFWIDVLTIYSDFVKSINIDSVDKLVDMPLFFNNCLLINNKYIFWKYWYDDGIRFVKDIIKDSGQILSLQELQAKMNKPVNFLHYGGIKKVLSTYIVSVQNVKLKDYKVH